MFSQDIRHKVYDLHAADPKMGEGCYNSVFKQDRQHWRLYNAVDSGERV